MLERWDRGREKGGREVSEEETELRMLGEATMRQTREV